MLLLPHFPFSRVSAPRPQWRSLEKAGWLLLDVRPPEEVQRVSVLRSVAVPLFVTDPDTSLSGFLKQATTYFAGAWRDAPLIPIRDNVPI